jgi:hypothetical protein
VNEFSQLGILDPVWAIVKGKHNESYNQQADENI